jgi:alpha-glucosidase
MATKIKGEPWLWWKHGIVYHIYPRSFKDSNADGIGDIQGIINKLDYFVELGIDAIWLSPVFESPQADFGYDISNYKKVDPIFGSNKLLNNLIKKAHDKNIKVILDLVLNHTSDQHPWFLESKKSTDNPKRDWYIWEAPVNNKKPNNWRTSFGEKAWQYDNTTDEYYYHSFLKNQPDLNWRNPSVKKAMFKMVKYWLDQGIDGFRLDVINFIVKDKKLRNNPSLLKQLVSKPKIYTRDRPKALKILKSLRSLLDKYPNKAMVGEIFMLPPGKPELPAWYLGNGSDSLHLAFDFSLVFQAWSAKKYRQIIARWLNAIPANGWPSWVLSNHDLQRSHNRRFYRMFKTQKARLEALLMLTLKGTPFIYYGQEIGMQNGKISRKKIQDPLGKRFWPFYTGRDKARTPMQWNRKPFAGFSKVEPWLPVNKNYAKHNVAAHKKQADSLLNHYKTLIQIRRSHQALSHGTMEIAHVKKLGIILFKRRHKNQELLVALNFLPFRRTFPKNLISNKQIIYTSAKFRKKSFADNQLGPFEGCIFK